MNDKICIKNLKIECEIGAYEEERGNKQTVVFDIELDADLSKATKSDDLNDTVDYFELTTKIVEIVKNSHFILIEKLADYVARFCLKQKKVVKANVKISKPNALKQFGADISVVITREV